MADIVHDFIIKAPIEKVFDGISQPDGLNRWWTKNCTGQAELNGDYQLGFGPEINWPATVSKYQLNKEFELTITDGNEDWVNTSIGFSLSSGDGLTELSFYHKGWPTKNKHYKISCYCWAMYLRVLKRFLEFGEEVPYEERLDV